MFNHISIKLLTDLSDVLQLLHLLRISLHTLDLIATSHISNHSHHLCLLQLPLNLTILSHLPPLLLLLQLVLEIVQIRYQLPQTSPRTPLSSRSTQRDRFRFARRSTRRLTVLSDHSTRKRTGIRPKYVIVSLLLEYFGPFLYVRSRSPSKVIPFIMTETDPSAIHLFEFLILIIDLKVISNFLKLCTILLPLRYLYRLRQLHLGPTLQLILQFLNLRYPLRTDHTDLSLHQLRQQSVLDRNTIFKKVTQILHISFNKVIRRCLRNNSRSQYLLRITCVFTELRQNGLSLVLTTILLVTLTHSRSRFRLTVLHR